MSQEIQGYFSKPGLSCWGRQNRLCVLKATAVKCQLSIDILIDIPTNTWLTSPLILRQHSTNILVEGHSRVNKLSKTCHWVPIDTHECDQYSANQDQLSMECQLRCHSSVSLVSTKYRSRCQSSVSQDVVGVSMEDINQHSTTDAFNTHDPQKQWVTQNFCWNAQVSKSHSFGGYECLASSKSLVFLQSFAFTIHCP